MPTFTGVTQTTFYDPNDTSLGNCTEACIATLLGLRLEDVPSFRVKVITPTKYWDLIEAFLLTHGKEMFAVPDHKSIEGIHMVSGPSPRGGSHCVLYENDQLVWDPHPSRTGILKIEYRFLMKDLEEG